MVRLDGYLSAGWRAELKFLPASNAAAIISLSAIWMELLKISTVAPQRGIGNSTPLAKGRTGPKANPSPSYRLEEKMKPAINPAIR